MMLEDAMSQVELALAGAEGSSGSAISVQDADLPPRFVESARPLVGAIRADIERLARELGIKAQHHSAKRAIGALLTAEIVRVDDSYATRLRGYGSVDPRAKAVLDPALDDIRSKLTELLRSLHENAGPMVAHQ